MTAPESRPADPTPAALAAARQLGSELQILIARALDAFGQEAVERERERCAKLADERDEYWEARELHERSRAAKVIADAIRGAP